jgi:signal transduction histidine kinase
MVRLVEARSAPADDGGMTGCRADSAAPAARPLLRPRVVWASADPALRDEVTRMLADDFDVIDVIDGATAWPAVHEHLPEIVLADLMMPHVGGVGLLAAMRADPRTASVPMILVVDHLGSVGLVPTSTPVADYYLVKPVAASELLACVRSLIARSHAGRAAAFDRARVVQAPATEALVPPEVAQIERYALHRELLDLTAIARAVFTDLRARDPSRVADLRVVDAMAVNGDRALVTLSLSHVLGNAWKFTRDRAIAEIVVESERTGVFVVRDNGVGFDMAERERLFRPLQRLRTAQDFDGAGVGLAVVRRVIERHGGEVWAYGRAGRGATFWFTLGPGSDPRDE